MKVIKIDDVYRFEIDPIQLYNRSYKFKIIEFDKTLISFNLSLQDYGALLVRLGDIMGYQNYKTHFNDVIETNRTESDRVEFSINNKVSLYISDKVIDELRDYFLSSEFISIE